jgi:hypothetical protein
MPKIEYRGHHPIIAVNRGISPIKAKYFACPGRKNHRAKMIIPRTTRTVLSIFPAFFFIVIPPIE